MALLLHKLILPEPAIENVRRPRRPVGHGLQKTLHRLHAAYTRHDRSADIDRTASFRILPAHNTEQSASAICSA